MSKQTINIGASPNDGTGTPLRTSFDYTNQNFTELYTALGGGVGLPGATTQVIFNDGGTNLAGDAGLVYNKTTDALTVAGLVTAGSAAITGDLTVDTSTLKVDATNDQVGIGTAAPIAGSKLDVRSAVGTGIEIQSLNVVDTSALAINNGGGLSMGYVFLAPSTVIARAGCIKTIKENATDGNYASAMVFGVTANGVATAERMRLDSTGNVKIANGNLVMSTSGKGIDFSATADGSGTMTSELLNDYEEGTFTATLNGSVTNPATLLTTVGKYTKIGRTVTAQVFFSNIITTGYSGRISISGLPFANGTVETVASAGFYGAATFTGSIFGLCTASGTAISMYSSVSNSAFADVTFNPGSVQYIWANLTYTV
jgi:hypothetical protein